MPRRGGGSGGARTGTGAVGGGGVMRAPPPREVVVSKKISWVLRHGAEKEGLELDGNGYARVDELLQWRQLRSLNVSFAELQTLVATNDKQRYQLVAKPLSASNTALPAPSTPLPSVPPPSLPIPDPSASSASPDPSHYLIRASQGHSLPIASSALLTPIRSSDPDFPAEVVHGTFPKAWASILESGGLSRMSRRHVHFATGVPKAEGKPLEKIEGKGAEEDGDAAPGTVVSGMRLGASVLVWVDVGRSIEEGGLEWWRSANGVVLTEGDGRGFVGLEFVRRVERRGSGTIWEPGRS